MKQASAVATVPVTVANVNPQMSPCFACDLNISGLLVNTGIILQFSEFAMGQPATHAYHLMLYESFVQYKDTVTFISMQFLPGV